MQEGLQSSDEGGGHLVERAGEGHRFPAASVTTKAQAIVIAAQGSQAGDLEIVVVDIEVAPKCARMDMIESSLLVDGVFEPSGSLLQESLLGG